jgi:hypothetical protein
MPTAVVAEDQVGDAEHEEDQPAPDAQVVDRDAEQRKNQLAGEQDDHGEPDRGEHRLEGQAAALGRGEVLGDAEVDGDDPHRVDGHEERQEAFDVGGEIGAHDRDPHRVPGSISR